MSDERAAELCGATDHAFMNCIFEGEPENIGPFVFLVVCRIRLGGMQPAESGTHE